MTTQDKGALRKLMRQLGRELDPAERDLRSRTIRTALSALIAELRPQRIALYLALPDEPDLAPLLPELARDYELYLPRVVDRETIAMHRYSPGDSLEEGASFHLVEPTGDAPVVEPARLDLIVVPALAYDREGYRLGRGGGYYDRYLRQTRAYTVGVSLGLGEIEALPREPWDIPLDQILSPFAPVQMD